MVKETLVFEPFLSISQHTMEETGYTLTSSPGKVLVAGGYLVLSPAYPGLVVSTDSRFYTLIAPTKGKQPAASQSSQGSIPIRIHSPQFIEAQWTFQYDDTRQTLELAKESADSPNAGKSPFLCLSLIYALTLALQTTSTDALAEKLSSGLDIWVLADNDFYSQRKADEPTTSKYLRSLPPFNPLGCAISNVHKTGLGSSAALTTSLVSALLVHLGVVSKDLTNQDLALIHNAAQLAHCAAQGKVGSGFDVSSAVWGSQVYRRFDPATLEKLLADIPSIGVQGSASPATELRSLPELLPHLHPSNPLWQPSPLSSTSAAAVSASNGAHPTAVEGLHYTTSSSAASASSSDAAVAPSIPRPAPLQLPPRIEMLLADVDAGSNTPSLVGKVNDWKKRKPEWASQLYDVIATSNQSLADALLALRLAHDEDPQTYHQTMDEAMGARSKTWSVPPPNSNLPGSLTPAPTPLSHLVSVRNSLRSIRAGMRELGKLSGAPIEPDSMGRVIQSVIDGVDGVVGGGVPGAGGYDAMYLLYISPRSIIDGDERQESKIDSIEKYLLSSEASSSSSEFKIGLLLSRAGQARLQEGQGGGVGDGERGQGGLRLHDQLEDVKGLAEAVSWRARGSA